MQIERALFIALAGSACLLLCRCPLPGSRHCVPCSDWERDCFEEARRDVHPEDVRADPLAFRDTLLAWAGVIVARELTETDDGVHAEFLVEHDFCDWIEDFGLGPRFLLSPRGEGRFRTAWEFRKGTDFSRAQRGDAAGDMVIVYGTPRIDDKGVITLLAHYVRGIPAAGFSTEALDYGREAATGCR